MSKPSIRFVHGKWTKNETKPKPVDTHALLVAAIHNLGARVTCLEQTLASITTPAAKPARSRKAPQKSAD